MIGKTALVSAIVLLSAASVAVAQQAQNAPAPGAQPGPLYGGALGMPQGVMGGYAMGPGMMGPGMMGGYGMMGPGMMGGYGMMGPGMMMNGYGMMGHGQNAGPVDLKLSADEVKANFERMLAFQGNSHIKVGPVTATNADTITVDIVTTDKGGLVQRYLVNRHYGFVRSEG